MCPNTGPNVFPHKQISLVRQPHHQRVGGLPAGHGDQLHPSAADLKGEGVLEVEIDDGDALAGQPLGTETPLDGLDTRRQGVFEGERAAAGAVRDEAFVVVSPCVQFACATTVVSGSRTLSRPPT